VQDICHECGGNVVVGETCGECGQLAAPDGLAGTLTVATSVAGRRRVVTVERGARGRVVPGADYGPPGRGCRHLCNSY